MSIWGCKGCIDADDGKRLRGLCLGVYKVFGYSPFFKKGFRKGVKLSADNYFFDWGVVVDGVSQVSLEDVSGSLSFWF